MSPLRLEVQTGVMLSQPEEEPASAVAPSAVEFPPVVCFPGRRHPHAEEEEEPVAPPFVVTDTLAETRYTDNRETSLLVAIDNDTGNLTCVDFGDWVRNIDLICSLPSYGDTRWYVCWKAEGAAHPTELAGVRLGRGTKAYNGLVAANGGSIRGLHFKRASDPSVASFWYQQEAREHDVPLFFTTRIFLWH